MQKQFSAKSFLVELLLLYTTLVVQMGITGLAKLIADNCPKAIKEGQIKHYFGRKIAIDASMSLYQFLIAVRPDDMNAYTLMNESGEQTR